MKKYEVAEVDLPYQQVRKIVEELEDLMIYCSRKSMTEENPEKRQYLRGVTHGCVKGSLALTEASRVLRVHQFSSLAGISKRTQKYTIALLMVIIVAILIEGNIP